MVNLWPEKVEATQESPLAIVSEQAKVLAKSMENKIKAEVLPVHDSENDFKFDFFLVAPKLGNYRYRLFAFSYPIDLYPVQFYIGQQMARELGVRPQQESNVKQMLQALAKSFESPNIVSESDYVISASSEPELLEVLKRVLGSKRTLTVLQALLAQLKAA